MTLSTTRYDKDKGGDDYRRMTLSKFRVITSKQGEKTIMKTELYYELKERIEKLQDYKLVSLWNQCCEELRYTEDMIYPMTDFEMICGDSFKEIYDHIDCTSFDLSADFFYIDSLYYYRSLDSSRLLADSPIDLDILIDWCFDNEIWYDELDTLYDAENDDDED